MRERAIGRFERRGETRERLAVVDRRERRAELLGGRASREVRVGVRRREGQRTARRRIRHAEDGAEQRAEKDVAVRAFREVRLGREERLEAGPEGRAVHLARGPDRGGAPEIREARGRLRGRHVDDLLAARPQRERGAVSSLALRRMRPPFEPLVPGCEDRCRERAVGGAPRHEGDDTRQSAAPKERDPRDGRVLEVSEERGDPGAVEHENVRLEEKKDVSGPLERPLAELDDVEGLDGSREKRRPGEEARLEALRRSAAKQENLDLRSGAAQRRYEVAPDEPEPEPCLVRKPVRGRDDDFHGCTVRAWYCPSGPKPFSQSPPFQVPPSHTPPQNTPPRNVPARKSPRTMTPDSKVPPSQVQSTRTAPRFTVPDPNVSWRRSSPSPRTRTGASVISLDNTAEVLHEAECEERGVDERRGRPLRNAADGERPGRNARRLEEPRVPLVGENGPPADDDEG